jgi:cytochrome c oxidase subunit 2
MGLIIDFICHCLIFVDYLEYQQMIRLKQLLIAFFLVSSFLGAQPSLAQMYPMDSDVGVNGEELFKVCSFCHGTQGQGGPALDAPALAGMEAWYVERQLHNFRNRVRGTHYDDVPGVQMSIVSGMVRNQATIENIAAHIESMEPGAPPELTRQGDVAGTARPFIWRSQYAALEHPEEPDSESGKTIYAEACTACHGETGQGNEALGSPKLTDLSDWYMERQLQYFRDGLRGADPTDTFGLQMAAFAKTLEDDQAIADVVAYIKSL